MPPVALSIRLAPAHTGLLLAAVAMTDALITTLVEAVDVQPAPLDTVTVYVPPAATVVLGITGFCAVDANPFGPVQEYEVPPLALRLREVPAHIGLLLDAAAVGVWLTVTEKLQIDILPAASAAV